MTYCVTQANFNMGPGCPYFPAAYNLASCGPNFAIGLEYLGLMLRCLAALPSTATWEERLRCLTLLPRTLTLTLTYISNPTLGRP